jgi:hypothetical protein
VIVKKHLHIALHAYLVNIFLENARLQAALRVSMFSKPGTRHLTTRVLITIPIELLEKIDRFANESNMNRAAFICDTVNKKFFWDECKKANRREERM